MFKTTIKNNLFLAIVATIEWLFSACCKIFLENTNFWSILTDFVKYHHKSREAVDN